MGLKTGVDCPDLKGFSMDSTHLLFIERREILSSEKARRPDDVGGQS